MLDKIIAIGVTLLVSFLGINVGGYAEDQMWLATHEVLPNCEKWPAEAYEEECRKQNKAYYDGKALIQSVGLIVPLSLGLVIIYKVLM